MLETLVTLKEGIKAGIKQKEVGDLLSSQAGIVNPAVGLCFGRL